MMIVEAWIEKIARRLQLAPEEVRRRNFYAEGGVTHYNQRLENCTIARCWEECGEMADLASTRTEVQQFNAANRWKKRNGHIILGFLDFDFDFVTIEELYYLHFRLDDDTMLQGRGDDPRQVRDRLHCGAPQPERGAGDRLH